MKKIATLLFSLGLIGASHAQVAPSHVKKRVETLTKQKEVALDQNAIQTPKIASVAAPGDTIAYYDFAGGLQGWTATTNSGPATWVQSTTGSTGQYSSSTPIASPTSSNGFLKLDLDGSLTPTPAAGFTNTDAFVQSPIIDLSNEPGVVIQFHQNFRPFSTAELTLGVSNNGGATWTDIDVRGGVSSNSASANPVIEKVLVSQLIGGSSQARIRFKWSNSSHYVWMIDDVLILKQDGAELGLEDVFYKSTVDTSGRGLYYTQIPLRHANVDTLFPGVRISNIGLANNTNVQVQANLTKVGGGLNQTISSGIFTVPGTTSRLDTSFNLNGILTLNGGLGDYDFTIGVSGDSTEGDNTNNVVTESFRVTDTVYSRDIDQISFISQRVPQEILANYYQISRPDTVTSITIRIGNPGSNPGSSSIGAVVKVYLYDGALSNPVAQSAFYTINSTGFHTIPIPHTPVTPGAWFAGFEVVQDSAWLAIDGDRTPPFYTTYENIGGVLGTGGTWYYANFTSVPWIRMNVKPFTCPDFNPTLNVTDAQCGQNDGSATVTPTAGNGPYTYLWETGDNQNTVGSLGSGTYEVTITDAVGCAQIIPVNIGDLGAPSVSVVSNVIDSCFGDNIRTGSIEIAATGGTGGLTYIWSTGGSSNNVLSNLARGIYIVTVQDSLGCKNIQTITVGGPSQALGGTFATTQAILCNGDANGAISVNVTGGTSPYNYSWTNGGNTAQISGLAPGTFGVTISDAYGCVISGQRTLTQPPALFVGGSGVAYTNNSERANISLSVSGGVAPYTYNWSGPDGFTSTNQNLTGLTVNGEYIVQVTDDNDCEQTRSFLVDGIIVGVESINGRKAINVYPNPTTGLISIDGTNMNGSYTLNVKNILGATVHQGTVNFAGAAVNINLASLSKGVYTVELTNEKGNIEYINRLVIK